MMKAFLTREIIIYSLIPALIAMILALVVYFLCLKKENRDSRFLNYFVKAMIAVMIFVTLPLIVGYTFWIIEMFSNHGVLFERISFVILIIFLSLMLLALLIWLYLKTLSMMGLVEEKE